uniref:Tankyrase 1-binding protein C-terminal domain-containing protein n=1 Tax=Naja naja TaxID=35670 RepID=A0A8C6XUM8_NAJNA
MRPLRRAMATQVELSSALTSLAGINEPRTEAAFRHSFIGSLSDASRKPGEGPRALAPLTQEDRGHPVGPATMPSTTSRSPWTPKPFSRETSSDTFATVKPPIPALKPSSATPKPPPTFAQTFEDAAKGPPGNVPPLLDQKPMESKSPVEPGAHLPFYLSAHANTVILFESRRPAKGRAEEGGSKAQEGQLLRSQSEKWPPRQPSLSMDPRPVSWAPHWKEAFAGGPKDSAGSLEPQQSLTPSTETHSQAGGRPAASAGFRESWQEPTQPAPPEAASGPGTPRPRLLPTDLMGRLEAWQKQPCLAEGREKSFLAAGDRAPEATGARSTAAGLSGAAPSGPREKSASSQLAESPQSCLPSVGGAAPPGQTVQEDVGQKCAEELGSQGKPSVGQPSASQSQPLGETGEVIPQEAGLRKADPPDASDGCPKKAAPLPDPSAKPWAPLESQSLRCSPGKEIQILNIQQRIQVLTAENAGFKAGGLRSHSFRSRPLSADLTKMFSGPVTAGELKPKRPPEWTRKPAGEMQEAPEEEMLPVGGAAVGEAGMAGSPWKPPLLAKTPSMEGPPKREGSFAKGRPYASLPEEEPGLVLSPKARTASSSSSEDACLKTVRATMFEHHVQRHSVVASQLGAEPALLSLRAPFGGSPSRGQEFQKERMLGDSQLTKASSWEAGGPEDPRPFTEDKGSPRWAEDPLREKDSLLTQRIEPRYEILQTVGERAQSEAVAAVSGGKAVTLRRQRHLKENRRAGGGGKSEGCRGASAPGTGPLKDLPASGRQAALHSEGTGPERNWAGQQAASEKAASFRVKDGGHVGPWLETRKERRLAPADVLTEGALGPKGRTLQGAGAGAPETDGWEGRAGVLDQKTSRGQSASCPGLLFSLDLKPPQGPEDPEGQKLRSARCGAAWETWEATAEGKEPPEISLEVSWASSVRAASAAKGSGRWRRKTLPHGSARLEGPAEPPPGAAGLASGREALHPMGGSAAKRSPQALRGLEPRQAEVTSPSGPKKPLSPSEPKATYFAVTCQISEEINTQPGRAAAVAPCGSASRRARPSTCQHRESFSEGGSSPARPLQPGLSRGAAGTSRDPPTEARDQELPQGQPEASAEGRLARADPALRPGARSPSYLAPLQQHSQPKSPAALGLGGEQGEGPDHYRSRVVDIDELMAEYGGESQKLCAREGQRESSFFPWEKWPPRTLPCSSDQREEKTRVEHSLGGKGPGTEGSRVRGSDPLEARVGKCSPPQWGKPDTEKPKPRSAEPPGPRTKTSFPVGREQGEGTGQGPQSAKGASPGAHPAHRDLGGLWKEASPKQWAVLAPAGGGCPSSDLGGGKPAWKAEPQAGVWGKGPPAAQQPGAERSSASASPGTGAVLDLKRCSSEKSHPSPARLSFPSGPRLDPTHACQRLPPERPGVWLSKGSPSPGDCFSHAGTRDLGEGGLPVDRSDAAAIKRSPFLLAQRWSDSFYNEQKTDHWPGDHLKQCFGRPSAEARDTDVLVQEADSSFTPASPSSEGSVAPAQKPSPGRPASWYSSQRGPATAADRPDSPREQRSHSLDGSSPDADPAKPPPTEKGSPDFSFLEQTARLDSRVLKSRVLLGKRRQRHRAPISHTLRRSASRDAQPAPFSAVGGAASGWMFRDSTEEKPPRAGEEEEPPPPAERLFPAQPRLPLFPSLAPSTLKAGGAAPCMADGAEVQEEAGPAREPHLRRDGSRLLPCPEGKGRPLVSSGSGFDRPDTSVDLLLGQGPRGWSLLLLKDQRRRVSCTSHSAALSWGREREEAAKPSQRLLRVAVKQPPPIPPPGGLFVVFRKRKQPTGEKQTGSAPESSLSLLSISF